MASTTQLEIGRVVSLWRYPVKSMMGEELNAAEVVVCGLLGDRAVHKCVSTISQESAFHNLGGV